MNILFVSPEMAPLAKVGGLADVVGSLPKALRSMGHDVRVLMPQYKSLDTTRFPLSPVKTGIRIPLPLGSQTVNLNLTDCGGVPVYTLENQEYFGTREVYFNDLERFFFFSRAAFEILPQMDWQPRVVHCHDWLTALAVMWIKKAGYPYATVFTIHNLTYQGFFDENFMRHHDLKKDWDYSPPGAPRPPRCFISQAILWADMVTAVSETYAREITTPELGVGLDALLRYRGESLVGILNGLDTDYWDTQTDPFLPVNFGPGEMPKRTLNKIALQKVCGLPVDSDIPLIGMVQRLDEQKGLDILLPGVDQLLNETGAQLVILGEGWDNYENAIRQLASRYPRQVASYIAFEIALAHLIYAGCDMFLMPSKSEPFR
jgi:starch synthase